MSVISQPELHVRAKLAELERVHALAHQAIPDASATTPPASPRLAALRRRLGQVLIHLGTRIAGAAAPAPVPRIAPHRPGG